MANFKPALELHEEVILMRDKLAFLTKAGFTFQPKSKRGPILKLGKVKIITYRSPDTRNLGLKFSFGKPGDKRFADATIPCIYRAYCGETALGREYEAVTLNNSDSAIHVPALAAMLYELSDLISSEDDLVNKIWENRNCISPYWPS